MWRLLLLLSALPIAIGLAARWWFGLRVLADDGKRACRCNPENWARFSQTETTTGETEKPAGEFGRHLRLKALSDWAQEAPKAAGARENSRKFGMAVPPLAGIVAIFAVIVSKLHPFSAVVVVIAATALAAAMLMLSLAPELRAIARASRAMRESRAFPRKDDEDFVIRSAVAHAWKETLPPILLLLQR